MPLDQSNRHLGLQTPLGENAILLTSFTGEEGISRLPRFQLETISDDNGLSPTAIVGKRVTFSVNRGGGTLRYFNGFVSRFVAGDEDETGRRNYRAEVVPWFWFLTLTSDCRIFQDMTVVDIIEKVFADHDVADFDTSKIQGHHPKRTYTVQYRESDYQFVCRLCEEEGIFWFVKHAQDKHTLVLSDAPAAYFKCDEASVEYPRDFGSTAVADHITSWEHRYEFRTGKFAQTDYNFETPSTSLLTNEQTVVPLPGMDKYEQYEYPGLYGITSDGSPLTRTRMEEEEARYDIVEATSLCKSFTPGGTFDVKKHRSSSEEGKSYVITSIRHIARESLAYESGAASGFEYRNEFACIPKTVKFRPGRQTPKPLVHGIQTAVVVGPSGEKIFPDKYGRVKVQFHWDRYGKRDENSSCWIRVSSPWAGQGWGGVSLPHVGQEVIVSFEHGDIDRPIIVGRVYNAEQMPPLNLPAEKDWTINRDHYGNEINMKGDVGTISLKCPTHTSEIHLGRSINLLTLSDHVQKNKGHTLIETLGNWIQSVVGEQKIKIGADVYETFVGINHKWIGGWVSSFIGGYKTEIIVGKETKVIKGAKIEAIRGTVYKAHDGQEYKFDKTALKEKTPSLKAIVDEINEHYGQLKRQVKADEKIKIAGAKIEKAENAKFTAEAMYEISADNSKEKVKSARKIFAAEDTIKIQGAAKEKAADMKKHAEGAIAIVAPNIKLG